MQFHFQCKLKNLFTILLLIVISVLFIPYSYAKNPDPGTFFRYARVYGKIIHFDEKQDRAILFGSVFYKEPQRGWQLVQRRKFSVAHPTNDLTKKEIARNIGRCGAIEGVINLLPSQKEEVFSAHHFKLDPNGQIKTDPWYAFGITQRTEKIQKMNLSKDFKNFVAIVASAKKIMSIPEDMRLSLEEAKKIATLQKTKNAYSFRQWSNIYWNNKWCVPKEDPIQEELRQGVGGWQFYEGLIGIDNCYVTHADLQRKHIDKLMSSVPRNGGMSDEGPAVMCAHISIQTDKHGNIVRVDAGGFLHDNPQGWFKAFRNPNKGNAESWKLSISESRAKELKNIQERTHDDICWLSGNRVFVRDKDGNIIDQYFAVENSITRIGFNNVLDVLREIWNY